MSNNAIELSKVQKAYIDKSIARGLADIEKGRYSKDPAQTKRNILKHFEALKESRGPEKMNHQNKQ
jgi:hypothetical protein